MLTDVKQAQKTAMDKSENFTRDGRSITVEALADKIAGYAKVRLCSNPNGDPGHTDWLVHERDRYLICKALRCFGRAAQPSRQNEPK